MAIRDLPDMHALSPRAYISGKSPMAILQPLHVHYIEDLFAYFIYVAIASYIVLALGMYT